MSQLDTSAPAVRRSLISNASPAAVSEITAAIAVRVAVTEISAAIAGVNFGGTPGLAWVEIASHMAARPSFSPATLRKMDPPRFGVELDLEVLDVAGDQLEHDDDELVDLFPQEPRARSRFVPERRRHRGDPQRGELEHHRELEHREQQLREEAPLPRLARQRHQPRPWRRARKLAALWGAPGGGRVLLRPAPSEMSF